MSRRHAARLRTDRVPAAGTDARYPALWSRIQLLESELREARMPGRPRGALRSLHRDLGLAYDEAVASARAAYQAAVGPLDGADRVAVLRATRSPQAWRWAHEVDLLLTARARHDLQAGDDLGVRPPTVIRVRNRAASGPAIPGIVFGARPADDPAATPIGVDLARVVDGVPSLQITSVTGGSDRSAPVPGVSTAA